MALQQRLAAKRASNEKLRQQIAEKHAERDATRSACMSGIEAARAQMVRMQAELAAARHLQAKAAAAAAEAISAGEDPAAAASAALPSAGAETDEEKSRRQALQIQARALRHELAKWKHQVELMEVEAPKQEAEIAKLKSQLTHATDVLESTRNATRHAEVDLEHIGSRGGSPQAQAPCAEAMVERILRERTEQKNTMLKGKVKKLSTVASAQQLLIQRLEKQLVKEEGTLGQKAMQLAQEQKQHGQLKGALRKRSNAAVAAALGIPDKASHRARSSSVPSQLNAVAGENLSRSSSGTLPPIAA